MDQWFVQVEGRQYGPIGEDVLRQWLSEGRVNAGSLAWKEGMPQWAPLGTVLTGVPAAQPVAGPGTAAGGVPYSPSALGLKQHRGGMILTFGILSLVVCAIFGPVAWVMANNDLREMAAGTMDRSGESNTSTGRILGMVGTILWCAGACFGVAWLVLFIIIGASQH